MRITRAHLSKASLSAVVVLFGLGLIIGSGSYPQPDDGGTIEDDTETPELTCSGNPVTIDRPVFLIHVSDPSSRCYLDTIDVVANSANEARQCATDAGYLAEHPNQSRLCNYFFKTEIGDFCNVVETIATSATNAQSCVQWTNGNTTITNITAQVKPDDTPQFCSSFINGSAITAACQ